MRLLHTEIDVIPGRRPQQPASEGTVGPGSAILRLQNTTGRENAYTVRLRCESPYWRDDWYALRPLPPTSTDGAPAVSKADQYGANKRQVKVYVSRGGTRDIQIAFDLPQKPDSRAGLYPFTVIVETDVDGAPRAGRDRFTELSALAIVRPFYQWSLDLVPEERRVGLIRRWGEYEVVVSNAGNDWLYCDLKLPRHKDLLVESSTQRLAIPPPEPGEEHFQRSVPVKAATRFKEIRGQQKPLPLALTASRVDAPSVPPLPEGAGTANVGVAVTASATGEVAQTTGEPTLIYCPPVPPTLTDFLAKLVQDWHKLAGLLLVTAALIPFATVTYERIRYNSVFADPLALSVKPGGKLSIQGSYLLGSVILIKAEGKTDEVRPRITQLNPLTRQRAEIEIPGEIEGVPLKDGKKIRIAAQRLGFLPFLRPFLPKSDFSRAEVTVGEPPPPPPPLRVLTTGGKKKPGEHFQIALVSGPPFPTDKAPRVLVGGSEAPVENWDRRRITASVPQDAPEGSLPVIVTIGDDTQIIAGSIEVPPVIIVDDWPDSIFNDLINRRYDSALGRVDRILQSAPKNPDALALKAMALARLRRTQEALGALGEAAHQTEGQTGRARALTLATYGILFKERDIAKSREYFGEARRNWTGIVDVLENNEL